MLYNLKLQLNHGVTVTQGGTEKISVFLPCHGASMVNERSKEL
jgi:hypothetical protein